MADAGHPPGERASVRSLLGDILTRFTVLLRKEFDLARSEVAQNLNRAAFGAGLVVGAVILALTSLNVLAVAAVLGLIGAGVPVLWAVLAVGAAALLLAVALGTAGVARVKSASTAPRRSIDALRKDRDAAKEVLHG